MKNKFLALLTVLAVFGFTAISAQAQPLHNQPNGFNHHNGFNHDHNHYHTVYYNNGYYNNGYWYGPSAPGITLQFSF